MQTITGITSDANQTLSVVLDDGTVLTFTMYFILQQSGWFFTSFNYNSAFTCNGLRIVNSFNMLYQYRNIIPIGLACISVNDVEPTQINSFSSQASTLYVLDSDEVAQYTAFINGE